MRSLTISIVAVLLVLSVCELPAGAQMQGRRGFRGGGRGGPLDREVNLSDVAIDKAIEKGVAWLWTKQLPNGSWGIYVGDNKFIVGPTALAVYALLQQDDDLAQDARIVKAFDWFEKLPPAPEHPEFKMGTVKTYELGLMANAYQAANRTTKQKYAKQLEQIAKHLILSTADGSYNYDTTYKGDPATKIVVGESTGDNSNSQYGALGVWAWVLDGKAEVPKNIGRRSGRTG